MPNRDDPADAEAFRYWLRPFWEDSADGDDFREFVTLEAVVEFMAQAKMGPYDGDIFFGRLLENEEYEAVLRQRRAEISAVQSAEEAERREAEERATYERLKAKYEPRKRERKK